MAQTVQQTERRPSVWNRALQFAGFAEATPPVVENVVPPAQRSRRPSHFAHPEQGDHHQVSRQPSNSESTRVQHPGGSSSVDTRVSMDSIIAHPMPVGSYARSTSSLSSNDYTGPPPATRRPSMAASGKVIAGRQRSNSIFNNRNDNGAPTTQQPPALVSASEALLIPEFVSRQMLGSASSMIHEAANNLEQLHAMLRARQTANESETRGQTGAASEGGAAADGSLDPIKPEMYASVFGATTFEELDKLRLAVQHLHKAFASSGFLTARAPPPPVAAAKQLTDNAADNAKTVTRRPSFFQQMLGGGRPSTAPDQRAQNHAADRPPQVPLAGGRHHGEGLVYSSQSSLVNPFADAESVQRYGRAGSGDSTNSSELTSSYGFVPNHSRSNSDDSTNCTSLSIHSSGAAINVPDKEAARGMAFADGTVLWKASNDSMAQKGQLNVQRGSDPFASPVVGSPDINSRGSFGSTNSHLEHSRNGMFVQDPFHVKKQRAAREASPESIESGSRTTMQEQQQYGLRKMASAQNLQTQQMRRPSRCAPDDEERIHWEKDDSTAHNFRRPSMVPPLSLRKHSVALDRLQQPPGGGWMRSRLSSVPNIASTIPQQRLIQAATNGGQDKGVGAVTNSAHWQHRKMSLPGGSLTSRMATAGARDSEMNGDQGFKADADKARHDRANGYGAQREIVDRAHQGSDVDASRAKNVPFAPHLDPAPVTRARGNSDPTSNGKRTPASHVADDDDFSTAQRLGRPNASVHRAWEYRTTANEVQHDGIGDREAQSEDRSGLSRKQHQHDQQAQMNAMRKRRSHYGQYNELETPASSKSFPETVSTSGSDDEAEGADYDRHGKKSGKANDDDEEENADHLAKMPFVLSESASALANSQVSQEAPSAQSHDSKTVCQPNSSGSANQWSRWMRPSTSAQSSGNNHCSRPSDKLDKVSEKDEETSNSGAEEPCYIPAVSKPSRNATLPRRRPSVIVAGQVRDIPNTTSPVDAFVDSRRSGDEEPQQQQSLSETGFYSSNRKYGVGRRPSDVRGTGTSMGLAATHAATFASVNRGTSKATLVHKSSMGHLRADRG